MTDTIPGYYYRYYGNTSNYSYNNIDHAYDSKEFYGKIYYFYCTNIYSIIQIADKIYNDKTNLLTKKNKLFEIQSNIRIIGGEQRKIANLINSIISYLNTVKWF